MGRGLPQMVPKFAVYHPVLNARHAIAPMLRPRAYFRGLVLSSGGFLVLGDKTVDQAPVTSEFYAPDTNSWSDVAWHSELSTNAGLAGTLIVCMPAVECWCRGTRVRDTCVKDLRRPRGPGPSGGIRVSWIHAAAQCVSTAAGIPRQCRATDCHTAPRHSFASFVRVVCSRRLSAWGFAIGKATRPASPRR